MQPTCRQVPPRNGSFSTTTVFSPSSPARIAATYPPGPLPIIATSYFATLSLPSAGTRRRVRNPLRSKSRTVCVSLGLLRGHPLILEVAASRRSYPNSNGDDPANLEFYQPCPPLANQAFAISRAARYAP